MKNLVIILMAVSLSSAVFGQKGEYEVVTNLEGESLYNVIHSKQIELESEEKKGTFKIEAEYDVFYVANKKNTVIFEVDLKEFSISELDDKGSVSSVFSSSELEKDVFPLKKIEWLFVQYDLNEKVIVSEERSKDAFLALSSSVSEEFRTLYEQNISRLNVEQLISTILMYGGETIHTDKKDEIKLEKTEKGEAVVSGRITTEVKSDANSMINVLGEKDLEVFFMDKRRGVSISEESETTYSSAISKKRGVVYDYQLNGTKEITEITSDASRKKSVRTETFTERVKVK